MFDESLIRAKKRAIPDKQSQQIFQPLAVMQTSFQNRSSKSTNSRSISVMNQCYLTELKGMNKTFNINT